jgi:hypothetical protein
MARFARLSLLVVTGLLVAATAFANIPVPEDCVVPEAITVTPNADFGYTVTVNGTQGPVDGSFVELRFSATAEAILCFCVGQDHPAITDFTDSNGDVTFYVAGGGCIQYNDIPGDLVAQIIADGTEIGRAFVNSPDNVNSQGKLYLARDPNDPDPTYVADPVCEVAVGDAVYATGPISTGDPDFCVNYTPPYDDGVDVADAVIFTDYIVNGVSCTAD